MKYILSIGFLFCLVYTQAQSITFRVKDQSGRDMKKSGVSIRYGDLSQLKTTDENGNLTIKDLKPQQTIAFYASECTSNYTVPAPLPQDTVMIQLRCLEVITDQVAEFPGGALALRKYLADNMRYPQRAMENGIEGKVYVRFIVSTEGQISDVTVQRSIPDCPECDAEAIRLTESMPNWMPAKTAGKPVKSYFNLPVVFKLQ